MRPVVLAAEAVAGASGRAGGSAAAPSVAPRLSAVDVARLLRQEHLPTPEQAAVIEAPLEPLLVVAGAGSGKTETMAARVVWLVANELVRPEEILGLTFTRKAAGELSERVGARLRALTRALGRSPGEVVDERPRISTYNAYAGSLVRDHALRIGVEPDLQLLTEAGRWQLAARVVETWAGALDLDAAPTTVTAAVLQLAGSLAEHLLDPAEAAAELAALADALIDKAPAPTGRNRDEPRAPVASIARSLRARAQLMDLVLAFARRKHELGVLDFADQVALACRVAREVPAVGAAERAQYRVVLLDEYQDTSVAQVTLLAALFGGGHPVTAVGDPHQAIYGWRGASAGAIERFGTAFPRRDPEAGTAPARCLTLSTSWRNDRAVLTAANVLARPLRQRAAARTQAGLPLPVLEARPGARPGRVRALFAPTVVEEADGVARLLAEQWSPDPARPVTAAVLCRARAQMPLVAEALRAAGLPVELVGLGGLLSTPEVTDLHAALLVAHDPTRADAAMRLLTGRRLGIADLDVLNDHARALAGSVDASARGTRADEQASLVEAVERPPAATWRGRSGRTMSAAGRARVRELGDVLRAIRGLAHLPLPELVTAAERLLGLDIEMLAQYGSDTRRARRHLDEFTEVAAVFARGSQAPTLGAFLAWLEAAQTYERGLDTVDVEPDATAVQVLTVHAAKGLEWDVVAVVGLAEGTFPSYRSDPRLDAPPADGAWLTALAELPYPLRGDADDLPALDVDGPSDHAEMATECEAFRHRAGAHALGEERRLAYVAATRARTELVLAGSAWRHDARRPRPCSRFVHELSRADALTQVVDDALEPPVGTTNPLAERTVSASWPVAAPPERADAVGRAVAMVRAAAAGPGEAERDGADERDGLARGWARDAALLLAERAEAQRPADGVAVPRHLAASGAVRLVADPRRFALDLRRPVPTEPTVHARRGTRFHAWVEQHYGAPALLDYDELPGAQDAAVLADDELAALQRSFLASPWAERTPVAVEVELETPVAGVTVRARIDAVFASDDGFEVVDWKTGSPAGSADAASARRMQLSLYRLAWSRLQGVPLDRVRACFVHVAQGVVVEAEMLTEARIEAELAARLDGPGTASGGRRA